MPRVVKYQDETVFPRPNYWGKILIYNSPDWDILFPVVDIIRILPRETIIASKNGKNQSNIRLYGSQYNHLVLGIDLNNRRDYLEHLKCVKFIFIFSDTQDTFAENLIKYSETSNTPLICYSSLDSIYHFYEYSENKEKTVHEIKDPQQVIEKMESLKSKGIIDKYNDLFPEFEIIEPEEIKKISNLEKCLIILKDSQSQYPQKVKPMSNKLPFDPNFSKIKQTKEKVIYDEDLKPLKGKSSFSDFFKKK
jgi:hypothetical protein